MSLTIYKIRQYVKVANGHEWIDIATIPTDHEHVVVKLINDMCTNSGVDRYFLSLVKIVESEVEW